MHRLGLGLINHLWKLDDMKNKKPLRFRSPQKLRIRDFELLYASTTRVTDEDFSEQMIHFLSCLLSARPLSRCADTPIYVRISVLLTHTVCKKRLVGAAMVWSTVVRVLYCT